MTERTTEIKSHQGFIVVSGIKKPATLVLGEYPLELQVSEDGDLSLLGRRGKISRAVFISPTAVLTLLELSPSGQTNLKLGVASTIGYRVRYAVENLEFEDLEPIRAKKWKIIVDQTYRLVFVNGLVETISFPEHNTPKDYSYSMTYITPEPIEISCAQSKIKLSFCQESIISPGRIYGPKVDLTYPLIVEFDEEQDIGSAVAIFARLVDVFSLLVGEIVHIQSCKMQVNVDGENNYYMVVGAFAPHPPEANKPRAMTVFPPSTLAVLLDKWLIAYPRIIDAAELHMEAVENTSLPLEIRFQMFIQSIEMIHRKNSKVVSVKFDMEELDDAISKVKGMDSATHARIKGLTRLLSESGLHSRLEELLSTLAEEVTVIRPSFKSRGTRKSFVNKLVATRNYFAHRSGSKDKVLKGGELANATELLKFVSHCSLLLEIDGPVEGLAQKLLDSRFLQRWEIIK